MAGHNDLRGGAHAHGICADGPEVAVLGRRLIGRAGAGHVHAFLQPDAVLGGNLFRLADEGRVVRTGHVREPRAEFLQVGTDERVRQQVDMVLDNHEVSHMESQVGAAGGVGDKEVSDAQDLHHADGQHHQVHAVPFIIMDAPLHGDDRFAGQRAHNEIAFMADSRAHRETGNIFIRNHQRVLNLVRQFAQTAAQDNAHQGFPPIQAAFYIVRCQVNCICVTHNFSIILVIKWVILLAAALAAITTSSPSFS